MKKITLLLSALLIITAACNKIDTSKEVFTIMQPVEVTSWDPEYAKTVVQKIYIEEFTGHHCNNCPDGAEILHTMMSQDPTIIATAIHCLSFANAGKPPFDYNYKTPMGSVVCEDFNIKSLPKAMINRIENGANGWGFDKIKWQSEVAKIDRNNIRAGIELKCNVDETKQEIDAKVSVTIIKEIKNPAQLCVVLQQDGIISGQVKGDDIIEKYLHNHVLRTSFNRSYGIKLTPNGIVKAQNKYTTSFKLSYANNFPYSNFPTVIENCSVVAYLIDMETKEVIQVEQVYLK